ncbi:hypothetical protein L873DRAFT_1824450 [Choiromyces venosus 120613-1]|uniref:Uncharacterized protein n=1 Tax=Choiromyces venosus 120613-1 TaxID=1336337 RepID=A0A3N4IW78_9PEZI|nr:hypothetical protein L873DRAFT_1824451 [Choiromyces venosus 120613-1]RPA88490.1 hypothetical protein L873DRAFT_1824450 [Choiromyces venosus 120613-1]
MFGETIRSENSTFHPRSCIILDNFIGLFGPPPMVASCEHTLSNWASDQMPLEI